jgi:hypothetical protein
MRAPANNAERLKWLFTAIAAGVFLALVWYSRADAQTVTPTREGTADWLCCDDALCTSSTSHQRQDTAIAACVNRSFVDGKVRWLVPARYRIAVTLPAPPVVTPPATTRLTWTAPTSNTDGTAISQSLTYRVEAQTDGAWSALATVNSTSYDAPGTSGCWRVVAIAGGVASDPTGAACK